MTPERKAEINFSLQNLLDASTAWGLIVPLELQTKIATDALYDRVEYFPTRLFSELQVRAALVSKNALAKISSGHQSFRSERNIAEVMKHPNRKLAAMAFLTLPERNYSLYLLYKLQRMIGKEMPVVVYPHHEWLGEAPNPIVRNFKRRLIQPHPELLTRWRVTKAEELAEAAKRQNYGICLDLYHIRRRPTSGYTLEFAPWQEVIPALLPYTEEVHLGVGRSDFSGNFDSIAELKDLYTGAAETEIIPILTTIRNSGWRGPIVTEIPSSGIKRMLSVKRPQITPKELINGHKRIVQNVRQIMAF